LGLWARLQVSRGPGAIRMMQGETSGRLRCPDPTGLAPVVKKYVRHSCLTVSGRNARPTYNLAEAPGAPGRCRLKRRGD